MGLIIKFDRISISDARKFAFSFAVSVTAKNEKSGRWINARSFKNYANRSAKFELGSSF
jgi:hypothetical protein